MTESKLLWQTRIHLNLNKILK